MMSFEQISSFPPKRTRQHSHHHTKVGDKSWPESLVEWPAYSVERIVRFNRLKNRYKNTRKVVMEGDYSFFMIFFLVGVLPLPLPAAHPIEKLHGALIIACVTLSHTRREKLSTGSDELFEGGDDQHCRAVGALALLSSLAYIIELRLI